MVTETPEIYWRHVRPYMSAKRDEGRLNWVFNILEGRTEQEDVILRDEGNGQPEDAFLMLPDLNWDRKTMGSLHLLALVQRRDIWSLRDLRKRHVPWLRYLRQRVLEATVNMYPALEQDQLKLYVHCMFCFLLAIQVMANAGWQTNPPTITFTFMSSMSCWRRALRRLRARRLDWRTSSRSWRPLRETRTPAWPI